MITASHSTSTLGTILTANGTALKMFGYSRREFLGQNLRIIIPEPVASVHGDLMMNHIRTGREVCAIIPTAFVSVCFIHLRCAATTCDFGTRACRMRCGRQR